MSYRTTRRILWVAIVIVGSLIVLDLAGVFRLSPGWVTVEQIAGRTLIVALLAVHVWRQTRNVPPTEAEGTQS